MQCFKSLNISLSHSKSIKVIQNDALEKGVFFIPFPRHSVSNNGVILTSWLGVI